MASINFFSQDLPFKLPQPKKTANWLKQVVTAEKKKVAQLNFIFCSDEYLLSLNQKYLKHHTLTDIITFDNSEGNGALEGDIFISIQRVRENAKELQVDLDEEIHRVLVHGLLHLAGHSDKSPGAKGKMRKKEDAYLSLR